MPPANQNACVIDTHAWIWTVTGDTGKLGRKARQFLHSATIIYVPAICLWEVATLVEYGRITLDQPVDDWLAVASSMPPFEISSLSPEVAAMCAELGAEGFHSDPADRMIYATARVLDVPLVSADCAISAFEARIPQTRPHHLIWG